ncbi:right-handed parallel beta-helix repeat-containing protein [Streptomyces sp. H27-D2]|uniref:right-handed parallel beta-helix repeat-containing protein n=1 Tax=Streptomyces sp. H27-D2 TaxID=3046304 RepID=UPI002DBAE09D|nr:right-handed parallel beta-helix repeat-containing protein [Streptomyces sp. H27-D2]MEC4020183.1 right-handed parallel beta-helix repeat-containing protein [Streptomyces sp. H27-D2]
MRRSKKTWAIIAATTAGLLVTGPPAGAADPAGRAGRTLYVDCAGGSDQAAGTGPRQPWRTLARVNRERLGPGATVRFKRGTRCVGTLTVRDSGERGAPVRIDTYGTGAKPHIDGAGGTDAVVVDNAEYVELRDLEISNTGPAASRRRGVWIRLDDFGTGHHYVLSGLDVHDVNGDDAKDAGGSAGIELDAFGSVRPTSFDDVLIQGNTVRRVDRSGINMGSSWDDRPEHGDARTTWTPSTRVRIRGNTVADTGGDGIVVQTSRNALVEHNDISYFQQRSAGYNAGLWAWNADGTLFQFNEVSHGSTTRDGMAFDLDAAQRNTVFQYNYSHDNEGGFLLICNAENMVNDGGTVRYNVSRNDRNYGIVTGCEPATGARVHNNTISTDKPVDFVWRGGALAGSTVSVGTFSNNVFAGPAGSRLTDAFNGYRNNLYHQVADPVAERDPAAVLADPRFAAPGAAGPEGVRLGADSPALRAGVPLPGDGGRDYWGNPLPQGTPPDIGAHQRTR